MHYFLFVVVIHDLHSVHHTALKTEDDKLYVDDDDDNSTIGLFSFYITKLALD